MTPPRAARTERRARLNACRPTTAEHHRAPHTQRTIRAGFRAHTDLEHGGRIGYRCTTCARYLTALAAAPPATDHEPC